MKHFNQLSVISMLIFSVFTITAYDLAAKPIMPKDYSPARNSRNFPLKHRLAAKPSFATDPNHHFFSAAACVGSNNKPGILCSDGFCDTSPPNQCNGHGGISPGHQDNSNLDHVI